VLNAYARASGDEVRVVAGSAVGGASLVVHAKGAITKPEDFRGKTIATPQLGNTQDIACRVWLRKHGFKVNQLGGDVRVLPTANPDQLSLFQQGVLDAVWTVEPWVSRLEREADGKIFLEQKEAVGTVLATSVKMITEHEDLVRKFVAAHAELTEWINQHPDEAKALYRQGMKTITRREFSAALTDHAWPRLRFTSKIERASFEELLAEAKEADFLKDSPSLDRLLALPIPEKQALAGAHAD
jgi:NitT/TauT family transport system substrate-binding protein